MQNNNHPSPLSQILSSLSEGAFVLFQNDISYVQNFGSTCQGIRNNGNRVRFNYEGFKHSLAMLKGIGKLVFPQGILFRSLSFSLQNIVPSYIAFYDWYSLGSFVEYIYKEDPTKRLEYLYSRCKFYSVATTGSMLMNIADGIQPEKLPYVYLAMFKERLQGMFFMRHKHYDLCTTVMENCDANFASLINKLNNLEDGVDLNDYNLQDLYTHIVRKKEDYKYCLRKSNRRYQLKQFKEKFEAAKQKINIKSIYLAHLYIITQYLSENIYTETETEKKKIFLMGYEKDSLIDMMSDLYEQFENQELGEVQDTFIKIDRDIKKYDMPPQLKTDLDEAYNNLKEVSKVHYRP